MTRFDRSTFPLPSAGYSSNRSISGGAWLAELEKADAAAETRESSSARARW